MPQKDFGQLKVLVVDDQKFVRNHLRVILGKLGIGEVLEAIDATSAQIEVLTAEPDVILCDIHMPQLDGLDFVFWLRNHASPVAKTPVVMLTTDSSEESVHAARGMKVNGYLLKPVTPLTVSCAIERALR
jgi:DNA-binding NarL/FixJ family response regulator